MEEGRSGRRVNTQCGLLTTGVTVLFPISNIFYLRNFCYIASAPISKSCKESSYCLLVRFSLLKMPCTFSSNSASVSTISSDSPLSKKSKLDGDDSNNEFQSNHGQNNISLRLGWPG